MGVVDLVVRWRATGSAALIEITGNIIEDWGVYFSGWNAITSSYPLISCNVNHGGGKPKQIVFDNDYATNESWGTGVPYYWGVSWDGGGTEAGSAGSGLFDNNFRIVGQLCGGTSSNTCDGNGIDLFLEK